MYCRAADTATALCWTAVRIDVKGWGARCYGDRSNEGPVALQGGVAIWCLRYITKFCWVGKHVNIIVKPKKLPNPRPTQPKKKKVIIGNWATFSLHKYLVVFSWVGIGFI